MRQKSRVAGGTLAKVMELYKTSPEFLKLAANTRHHYDYAFRQAFVIMGKIPVEELRPSLMQKFLDKFSGTPAMQAKIRAAFVALETWSMVRDHLPREIMKGTKAPGGGGAREPWPDDLIALAVKHTREPLPTIILLAAFSGQRLSDVAQMRWQDILTREGHRGIELKQRKTGLGLWVPLTKELDRLFPVGGGIGHLVPQPNGSPYKGTTLSTMWWRERNRNRALEPLKRLGLSLHGLRASLVIKLRLKGANELEIESFVGMSRQMVRRYSRRADQAKQAIAALERLQNNVVRISDQNDPISN